MRDDLYWIHAISDSGYVDGYSCGNTSQEAVDGFCEIHKGVTVLTVAKEVHNWKQPHTKEDD